MLYRLSVRFRRRCVVVLSPRYTSGVWICVRVNKSRDLMETYFLFFPKSVPGNITV